MITLTTFRNMSSLNFPNYEINLLGEIRNIQRNLFLTPQLSINDKNPKPRFKIRDQQSRRYHILIEDAVALTFYDLIEPIGPYKNRILEIKEFMSLTPNDWKYVKDKLYNDTNYWVTRWGDVWDSISKRKMKPSVRNGYLRVSINGNSETIHRLVAIAWIPIPQHLLDLGHTFETLTVNHIKGNEKTNNHIANLEWMTRSENTIDSYEQGLQDRGRLYSNKEIHAICKALSEGIPPLQVSKKFNVNINYVRDLQYGKARTDITSQYSIPRFRARSLSGYN